ncbi:MAG: glycosyltransferase [Dehalococcoidia bacterium]|nr:glycosyltransferase [Dehalococcoidia bacterium]
MPLTIPPFSRRLVELAAPLEPGLRTVTMNNAWLWARIDGLYARLAKPSEPGYGPVLPLDLTGLPFGVNVAGHLNSESGTGEAARMAIHTLRRLGVPCAAINVAHPLDTLDLSRELNLQTATPNAINLVYINPDTLWYAVEVLGRRFFDGRYNIGVWNWELARTPENWRSLFPLFNEIWTPSSFVAEAVSVDSPVPVVRIPYPVPGDDEAQRHPRSHFRISDEPFVFLFLFHYHSVYERKNPLGVIEAFKAAFGDSRDVLLYIKASHATRDATVEMRRAAAGANVRVVNRVMSRREVVALYNLCDCYVSLHRSEGFGLTPLEAMRAGKPVVATAYGGAMDFMTNENSYLVRYQLTDVECEYPLYHVGSAWADPDLDQAAALMRFVHENPRDAVARAARAQSDIRDRLSVDAVSRIMRRRLIAIAAATGIPVPPTGQIAEAARPVA